MSATGLGAWQRPRAQQECQGSDREKLGILARQGHNHRLLAAGIGSFAAGGRGTHPPTRATTWRVSGKGAAKTSATHASAWPLDPCVRRSAATPAIAGVAPPAIAGPA